MLGFDGGAFYDIDADGALLEAAVKAASGVKAEKSGGNVLSGKDKAAQGGEEDEERRWGHLL